MVETTRTTPLFWGGLGSGIVALVPGAPTIPLLLVGAVAFITGTYIDGKDRYAGNSRTISSGKQYVLLALLSFISLNLGTVAPAETFLYHPRRCPYQ